MVRECRRFRAGTVLFEGTDARYHQLADELTRQIRDRVLEPQQRLLSEPALARQFGVSRDTVRAAIAVLERRGLLLRRRGVGTFVAGPRVRQDPSRLGAFYEAMIDQGLRPEPRLLEFRTMTPDPAAAARLGHETAVLLVRQFRLDGRPVALTRAYLHPDAVRATRLEAEQTTADQLIERFVKRRIENVDVRLRAETAGEHARYLDLLEPEPILVFERTSAAADGCGLEFTSWYLRPDVYEFGMRMHGPFELSDGFHHLPPAHRTQ
jgi:GntR family transcriptional regulator